MNYELLSIVEPEFRHDERHGKRYHYVVEWRRKILANGKPGNKWFQIPVPYTPLNECDICGKKSTPKKVHLRTGIYGWNRKSTDDFATQSKGVLCMGCWNKVRVLCKREQEAHDVRAFINQLQKDIANERKQNHQDHGRTA
jgi:hypothetical protein